MGHPFVMLSENVVDLGTTLGRSTEDCHGARHHQTVAGARPHISEEAMAMRLKSGKTRRKVVATATASALVLLGSLAACGGSDGPDKSSSKGDGDTAAVAAAQGRLDAALKTPTEIGITTPLAKAPPSGKTAYMIRINVEGPAAYADKWVDLCKKVGWTGKVIAVDPTDPQAGSNGIKQAVAAGADYIGVQVFGYDQVEAGMKVAKAAGVPVFFGSGVGDVEGADNGLYGSTFGLQGTVDLGIALLDEVITDSDGAADMLYVGYPDADIVRLAAEPTKAGFEKNCPECTWHQFDMSTTQLTNGEIANLIVGEVRKTPEIKYVALSVASAATGLREALDAAGLNDVKILVIGSTADQFDGVRDGDFFAIGTNGVADLLWAQFDQVLRQSDGSDLLQDQHESIALAIFDQSNIGDRKGWLGPEGYEDQYLKLWQIS